MGDASRLMEGACAKENASRELYHYRKGTENSFGIGLLLLRSLNLWPTRPTNL
jgi:hypothetical protein